MSDATCPCGSGAPEAACCGPIIAGTPAPTAQALMRSRYTAYVRGSMDHILGSHDPATREQVDIQDAARWSAETQWQGLEILATERGLAGDTDGVVEFVVRGVTRGVPFAQRERSRFRRDGDRWYYVDGKMINEPIRKAATPGRNDPCHCGSGMKFKRCHGA
ncbi:MAG TPA: YchJ family protein [Kofleriaceae bacterium]